ncbi:unnamed protein product, partial [Ilex paraguariensis]
GFHRYILENFNGDTIDNLSEREVQEFDPPSEVRALIEGQLLSMRAHAERFGMPSPPKRIIATGGASANSSILGSIASIFGCNVHTVQRPDSASLGAALRAAHGWLCNKKVDAGDQELVAKYSSLMKKRMEIENRLVQKLSRW